MTEPWPSSVFRGNSIVDGVFANVHWPIALIPNGIALSDAQFNALCEMRRVANDDVSALWDLDRLEEPPVFRAEHYDLQHFCMDAFNGTRSMIDTAWCGPSMKWGCVFVATEFGVLSADPALYRIYVRALGGPKVVWRAANDVVRKCGKGLVVLARKAQEGLAALEAQDP